MHFRIAEYFKHFLFPSSCCFCKSHIFERGPLCTPCMRLMVPVVSHDVWLTQRRTMRVYAAGAYQTELKKLILRKYVRDHMASYELARIIVYHAMISWKSYDFLAPIPMHWSNFMVRGYNQAELIAQELSRLCSIPLMPVLERVRYTQVQKGLSAQERQANVAYAFNVNREHEPSLKNKHILLVDDVFTTGSTVLEAARVLLPMRPAKLDVIVAARAL